jgi:esterase/lipase superfamily enzyme
VVDEVLPFTKSKNPNDFVIAIGASMGGYHAINIAMRYPQHFNRTIGLSGPYDLHQMSQPHSRFNWIHDYYDDYILECDPAPYLRELKDPEHLKKLKEMDIIFVIGQTDPLYAGNQLFTHELWAKDIWHAFRPWEGFAHDWPYWKEMIPMYFGGQ